MTYLYDILYFVMIGMTNIWFWMFMLGLLALGRYLLDTATINYAGKIESDLSMKDKKRRRRLIFWGRALFFFVAPFIIIFVILCIIAKRGLIF